MAAAVLRPQIRMQLRLLVLALSFAACGVDPCLCTRVGMRGRSLAGGKGTELLLGRVGEFETELVKKESTGPGSGTPAASETEDPRLDVPVIAGTVMDFLTKSEPSACDGRRLFIYPNLPPVLNQLALEACMAYSFCPEIVRDGLGSILRHLSISSDGGGSANDGNNSGGDTLQASAFERDAWLQTLQEGLGLIFHARVWSYDCLVSDWRDADAIYVPVRLEVIKWLMGFTAMDKVAPVLVDFLQSQPPFQRHGGADHFIVVGTPLWDFSRGVPPEEGGWGSNVTLLPGLQRVTFVSVEAMSWRPNTISFPYPTSFHPATAEELARWQHYVAESRRPYLVALSCASRPSGPAKVIREQLIAQCISQPDQCRYLNCSSDCPLGSCMGAGKGCSDPRVVAHGFLSARFCLQPRGDSFTRRSTFDAITAGCIPVSFDSETLRHQYRLHLPGDKSGYTVQFDKGEVEAGRLNVVDALAKISEEDVAAMRKRVIELMPNILYKDHRRTWPTSNPFKDVFDVGLDGIFGHLKDRVQATR